MKLCCVTDLTRVKRFCFLFFFCLFGLSVLVFLNLKEQNERSIVEPLTHSYLQYLRVIREKPNNRFFVLTVSFTFDQHQKRCPILSMRAVLFLGRVCILILTTADHKKRHWYFLIYNQITIPLQLQYNVKQKFQFCDLRSPSPLK